MDQLTGVFILFGVLVVGYVIFTATRRPPAPEESGDTITTDSTDLNAIAGALEAPFEKMAHPSDALAHPLFERAVSLLCTDDYAANQVRNYALGSNWVLQCAAFEALMRRDDSQDMLESVRARLGDTWAWPLYFAVRFIDAKSSGAEIVNILTAAQEWWPRNPMLCEELGAVFRKRLAGGERIHLGRRFGSLSPEQRSNIHRFVAALPSDARAPLQGASALYSQSAIDEPFLRSVGELITSYRVIEPVFATKQITRLLEELAAEAADNKPRSILIVGESGVGKTSLRREFARHLLGKGWRIHAGWALPATSGCWWICRPSAVPNPACAAGTMSQDRSRAAMRLSSIEGRLSALCCARARV